MFSKHCHLNWLTYFATISTIRPEHKDRNLRSNSLPDNISSPGGKMTRIRGKRNQDRQARGNEDSITNDTSTTTIPMPVRRELTDLNTKTTRGINSGNIDDATARANRATTLPPLPVRTRNNDNLRKISHERLNQRRSGKITTANHCNTSTREEKRRERLHKKDFHKDNKKDYKMQASKGLYQHRRGLSDP